ncbi:hypothetical protein CYLTODRAFT_420699 [Cylindrobasidium torrendii FP15055 ss-10]|uniref:PB1 domain-containing protein n=1 Tax=Cylindrobasidium torrendii FP15055 ss-10 TaxID=1314674 RepID=A0A0D7BFX4_9AGAR|nr:hypothetical protein CYLTODRAFT_420699 [Cylindrobasidium torrendii FP15055 ss-10]
MGQGPSVPQNKNPLVVNFRGRTAVITRHATYDETLAAIKTVKTFKPELSSRDVYLTAFIQRLGDEEFEITDDAWLKVIDSIDVLYIHIVGPNEERPPAPPYEEVKRIQPKNLSRPRTLAIEPRRD